MTPLRARFHGWHVRLRCLVGAHEWHAEVPVDDQGHRSAVLRERCLHCGVVTVGISQADGPRYHVTQAAARAGDGDAEDGVNDDQARQNLARVLNVTPRTKTPAGLVKGKEAWVHHDKPGGRAAQRRLRQLAKTEQSRRAPA